jgi:hypothetical protein
VQSPVSISGAARSRLFCTENQVPKAPRNISAYTARGFCPAMATKTPNKSSDIRIAASVGSSSSSVRSERSRSAQRRREPLPRSETTGALTVMIFLERPAWRVT